MKSQLLASIAMALLTSGVTATPVHDVKRQTSGSHFQSATTPLVVTTGCSVGTAFGNAAGAGKVIALNS